jgi:DNA-binding transcriptional MerR regulator
MTTERAHSSIGEVLSLLQEEFPDVTISKIRFLESQGLLDPERTPSGYRKFYDEDIDRLRWILRQQREHFLPLKVIKDRLAETTGTPADIPAPSVPLPQPEADAPAAAAALDDTEPRRVLDVGPSAVSLTVDELAAATGLTMEDLRELQRYGLIGGRVVGPDTLFDEDALVVTRLAAGFMKFGVEARHLRMYKVSAERESSFFEQVVMPMLKQRNPAARRQAIDTLSELADLGEGLRAAMLRQALREYAG